MVQHEAELLRALTEAAAREAKAPAAELDALRNFTRLMFADGVNEDVAPYTPAELAQLAGSAWAFSQTREAGKAKVRVYNPRAEGETSRLRDISVVEILNDNMPFLVDSAMAELAEEGREVLLVVHPIEAVKRGKTGKRTMFLGRAGAAGAEALRESLIHIHVRRIDSDLERRGIEARLAKVFSDVRLAVEDWQKMRERLAKTIETYKSAPPPIPVEEIAEAIQFLEWLADNNFTFLGMREYVFSNGVNSQTLETIGEKGVKGLGLLRDPSLRILRRGDQFVTYTPELREFLKQPVPLLVTKANVKSTIHRRVYLDYVGVKTFDEEGVLVGELRIVGLLTSSAYNRSVRSIPYLRRKAELVMQAADHDPVSHTGKALWNVLETFPRDELFQIDIETLADWAQTILKLHERPRIRVLPRIDKFDRFVSVLVYVPRDRFNTQVRIRIGEMLAEEYRGHVSAAYPAFPEGTLARVHFIIGRRHGDTPRPDAAMLEDRVAEIVRSWADRLEEALEQRYETLVAGDIFKRYRDAFSPAYRGVFAAESAIDDIELVEKLSENRPLIIRFHKRLEDGHRRIALKLFHRGHPIPLSQRVPILENLGFRVIDERSFSVDKPLQTGSEPVWMHDMVLEARSGEIDLDALAEPLQASYMAVAEGRAENDGYNALTAVAGAGWRDVAMIRAYSRYLRQIRVPYSQDYMWTTLAAHGSLAKLLIELFHVSHDPARGAEDRGAILRAIEDGLQGVPSLDEDSILRRFVNLITATVRTNFFQLDAHGQPRNTIAFKFDGAKVDGMPAPRSFREIFVYSPRVEGVHLRFGKIARGGLRWSDRPQDFRTEVLGLVKAQQVKNAVIVPVGSKGGFVPKQPPASGNRDDVLAEGIACYRLFVSSLLDITDNLDLDKVLPPDRVVRHDGDDPYLVVAADKGTASFSDIANGISLDHGFWLGDAFASGGSAGYDHKKMGITARGGWEAVKRHFREMNVDIQTTPFSVIGVGDMSGDVFGNGMLLSKKIRLVAAFDHRDIFIDPRPDEERSWEERKRLFELPRSSWQDYDRKLISKGGGVFSRKEKSIKLTPQIRELLGIDSDALAPYALISAILKARADLLWFGGIGTYVRASSESDDQVGDRANDILRVAASELNVTVIGEGANLGVTQRGRIEFALAGGRINTDAIDNSAGVNSSDMEVNIKIALGTVVREGSLSTAQRNRLLADMTGEVAGLVLRNNYLQTLAISLAERRGAEEAGFLRRLMRTLEAGGRLDRQIEFLPADPAIVERMARGEGFTRPELAVLLAYAKIDLFDKLLESSVPDDPYLGRELMRYFPKRLQKKFPNAIRDHRLRREIIATVLSNSMINRGGPSFATRIADQTGASSDEIARAFAVARDSFQLGDIIAAIDALDNEIGGDVQLQLYTQVQSLLIGQVAWHVTNDDPEGPLEEDVSHYKKGITELTRAIDKVIPDAMLLSLRERQSGYETAGVPAALARRVALFGPLSQAGNVIMTADTANKPLAQVAETYFAAGAAFTVDRLVDAAHTLHLPDYYDRLALNRTLDSLAAAQRAITARSLGAGKGAAGVEAWIEACGHDAQRARRMIGDIASSPLTLSRLSVAAGLLGDIVR
ncbi:MAG: NAD-glutamate dehydrogenase [Flavobacteriaceae bacterium]